MKDYYREYKEDVYFNPDMFASRERYNFLEGMSIEQKVKSEYVGLSAYFHDRVINESYFTQEQNEVIESTLDRIKAFIEQKEYRAVEQLIVSLQLLLGLDVKFTRALSEMIVTQTDISLLVDARKFDDLTDNDGYGRKKK